MSSASLLRDWDFEKSSPTSTVRLLRARSTLRGWSKPPAWSELRPFRKAVRWNVYFAFCPDGQLTAYQRDSISRIALLDGLTGLIVASPTKADIDVDEPSGIDALYWKDLNGYDFSAYALVLQQVAQLSPGCDLYIQNDSVFGPIGDVDSLIRRTKWRVSGFLGSSAVENHLQSYALFFRNLQPDLVREFEPALSVSRSLNHWYDVVLLQETRLARIAAQRHSVGSLWFDASANRAEQTLVRFLLQKLPGSRSKPIPTFDPSLINAIELLEQGFPFVKRSLFSRNRALTNLPALKASLINLRFPPELLK